MLFSNLRQSCQTHTEAAHRVYICQWLARLTLPVNVKARLWAFPHLSAHDKCTFPDDLMTVGAAASPQDEAMNVFRACHVQVLWALPPGTSPLQFPQERDLCPVCPRCCRCQGHFRSFTSRKPWSGCCCWGKPILTLGLSLRKMSAYPG